MNYVFRSYVHFWTKSFDFKGSTTRKEYWTAVLVSTALILPVAYASVMAEEAGLADPWSILLYLHWVPSYSIAVRRVRNAGSNPWWALGLQIPLLCFYTFWLLFQPSAKEQALEVAEA